jgi:ribosomal protein L30/L7E
MHGEKRNAYGILVRKPEGKRPLERLKCTREDNIKMDLKGLGLGDMNWIYVTQDREQWRALVNTVMKLRVL